MMRNGLDNIDHNNIEEEENVCIIRVQSMFVTRYTLFNTYMLLLLLVFRYCVWWVGATTLYFEMRNKSKVTYCHYECIYQFYSDLDNIHIIFAHKHMWAKGVEFFWHFFVNWNPSVNFNVNSFIILMLLQKPNE